MIFGLQLYLFMNGNNYRLCIAYAYILCYHGLNWRGAESLPQLTFNWFKASIQWLGSSISQPGLGSCLVILIYISPY